MGSFRRPFEGNLHIRELTGLGMPLIVAGGRRIRREEELNHLLRKNGHERALMTVQMFI